MKFQLPSSTVHLLDLEYLKVLGGLIFASSPFIIKVHINSYYFLIFNYNKLLVGLKTLARLWFWNESVNELMKGEGVCRAGPGFARVCFRNT